jgi:hypothetical protein
MLAFASSRRNWANVQFLVRPSMPQLRQEHVLSSQTVDRLSGTRYQRILTGDGSAVNRHNPFLEPRLGICPVPPGCYQD